MTTSSRALWSALVFSMIASLGACSSKKDAGGGDGSASDTTSVEAAPADATNFATDDGTASAATLGKGKKKSAISADGFVVEGAASEEQWTGRSRAPSVKEQPFQKEGRWMNAFYFVRNSGETWETLSELIYGRSDRADLISQWNGRGTLQVGRVIYYNSALRPEDGAAMKVVSEDYGLQLDQIEVKKGDTLSALARSRFGNLLNWKEISALNNLSNPDLIQVGQKLVIQPAQIDTRGALAQIIAQGQQQAAAATADVPPAVTAGTIIGTDAAQAPPTLPEESPTIEAPVTTAAPLAANSDLFMSIGIGIVLLALIVVVVRRRMQGRKGGLPNLATQTWDDAGNVTKLTRPKTGF